MAPASREALVAERLCGAAIRSVEVVTGGGNNQLWRVATADRLYALKKYPDLEVDQRDRLGHEFAALSFLRASGVTNVPAAYAADRQARYGLYEWIAGAAIPPETDAVGPMLEFMRRLHELREAGGANGLPGAVGAVLTGRDLNDQLTIRLERFAAATARAPELDRFLTDRFLPAWELARSADRSRDAGVLTLTASDFGTHNMLRRDNGQVVFVDFEYFGWDDPVKVVSDVLWHPAMAIGAADRQRFVTESTRIYGSDPTFAERLAARHALFGLRWALIVLNEFLPLHWDRRRRAGQSDSWRAVKAQQLEKSTNLVARAQAAAQRYADDGAAEALAVIGETPPA
jgi:hypothetical protein